MQGTRGWGREQCPMESRLKRHRCQLQIRNPALYWHGPPAWLSIQTLLLRFVARLGMFNIAVSFLFILSPVFSWSLELKEPSLLTLQTRLTTLDAWPIPTGCMKFKMHSLQDEHFPASPQNDCCVVRARPASRSAQGRCTPGGEVA